MKKFLIAILLMMNFVGIYAASPKTIAVLGDSYSTYQGLMTPKSNWVWYKEPKRDVTDVCSADQTWWKILTADSTQYRLGVNNSFSGSTICSTGYHGDDYSDRAFYTRIANLGNPDIIIVFGGTNDAWANSPMGDYKWRNWTKADLYNFRPAMACMLDGLETLYPNAQVLFILNSELKPEVNESVHEICKHYGVDCIDLVDIEKLGNHPSIKGMQAIADQVRPHLQK